MKSTKGRFSGSSLWPRSHSSIKEDGRDVASPSTSPGARFLLKLGTVSPKWIVGSKSAVPKIQTFKIPSLRFKVPSIKVPDLQGYRLD
jgi:hypothetical protein